MSNSRAFFVNDDRRRSNHFFRFPSPPTDSRPSVGWKNSSSPPLAIPVAFWVALLADDRLDRFKGFFDPWADPLGGGYQLIQSELGFGAGGLTGAGFGGCVVIALRSEARAGFTRYLTTAYGARFGREPRVSFFRGDGGLREIEL